MNFNAVIPSIDSQVSAVLIRADGSHRNCGVVARSSGMIGSPSALRRVWNFLKSEGRIPLTMGFFAFVAWYFQHPGAVMLGLVTNGAADAVANALATGPLANYKYVAAGTGNAAEDVAQTALGAEVGSRGLGVVTKSATRQFQVVGTVTFPTVGGAITEFGLFDANAAGNMWDRRVFAVINVNAGDSVQFSYSCDIPGGRA